MELELPGNGNMVCTAAEGREQEWSQHWASSPVSDKGRMLEKS